MLELNKYYIQNNENLRDIFTIIYTLIDDIYLEVTPIHIRNRRNIGESNLSDSEIITIAILGEAFGLSSEKSWFNFIKREYIDLFPKIGDRTRFNRTKNNLHDTILNIQKNMLSLIGYEEDKLRIIDSMPIPVCEFGRAKFTKSFKGIASYGYCASKKETFFGFKLHALCTQNGFISDFVLTRANVDDREAVWDLVNQYADISIIGDKGYVNKRLSPELKNERQIKLIFMKRDNDKNQYTKDFRQIIFKIRRRIETSFSQLSEQFNVNKVLSKSITGLQTRITLKILSHNICYVINKLLGNKDSIGKIKHLIFG